jgi:hypothetical protein
VPGHFICYSYYIDEEIGLVGFSSIGKHMARNALELGLILTVASAAGVALAVLAAAAIVT